MKKFSLSLVLLGLFFFSVIGQIIEGHNTYNEKRIEEYNKPAVSLSEYLKSGHFMSSLSENMESEFLQMGLFVVLTINLYQVGSSESNKLPEQKNAEDLKEELDEKRFSALQQQKHPLLWRLYEVSLSLALFTLFLTFFFLHAYGSWAMINEQNSVLQKPLLSFWQVFKESEFWFESFQNWQSEFFSVVTLCLFSIFLRQKGSAQSKKMHRGLWFTGE